MNGFGAGAVLSLFRAEWTKTAGNRWVVGFLIWIFPVGALAFMVVMALLIALVPSMRSDQGVERLGLDGVDWTEQAISVWDFPNSLLGRLIVLAFTSFVFAGEYQWGTWKNILPHSNRVAVVLIKFITVGLFVIIAFSLMSAIYGAGMVVLTEIAGGSHGPPVSGPVLTAFTGDYLQQAGLAFTLTLIAASMAALLAMAMRSILGGAIAGIILTYVEGLSILPMVLLAHWLDYPRLVHAYRVTPSYNVANIKSWLTQGVAEGENFDFFNNVVDFSDSMTFSIVLLGAWVCALVGLTVYLFNRQDMT